MWCSGFDPFANPRVVLVKALAMAAKSPMLLLAGQLRVGHRSKSLDPVWTRLRRLVASLMLTAVTAFLLHGGGMAGLHAHSAVSIESWEAAARINGSPQPDGGDGHGAAGVRASDICACALLEADHDGAGPNHPPHCGTVCGMALPSFGPGSAMAPATATRLAMVSRQGSGADPDGLKRPPRTFDII
ncbi:hypothetical protein [Microvirga soli]|uniref:hypothetical protein n=1 Tax=Microvirga soli TaxID=1854496 RepID=UPI00191EC886|nr:hypothetical protein [Microvirga soli]